MNYDTINHPLWPHEDETIEIHCTCCDRLLSDVEASDPCIIDGKTFKDSCAGSITQLRLQGYIKAVADRTNKLTDQYSRDLNWAQGYVELPQKRVNHI